MCYSDLPYLYTGRGFAELNWPYTDDAQVRARYDVMEYPVGISYFAWASAWVTHWAQRVARTSSAATAAPTDALAPDRGRHRGDPALRGRRPRWGWPRSTLLATWLLAGVNRRRPWDAAIFAVSPLLALTGLVNWDLLAVVLVAGALWAWSRGRPVLTGVLIGLGTATKLYPLFLLGGLLVIALRERRLRPFLLALGGAVGAWLVANAPAYLTGPDQWQVFWHFNSERGADLGSIWLVVAQATDGVDVHTINVWSWLFFGRVVPRRARAGPAGAAARRGWRSWASWSWPASCWSTRSTHRSTCCGCCRWRRWPGRAGATRSSGRPASSSTSPRCGGTSAASSPRPPASDAGFYWVAILVRMAAELYLVAIVARDVLRPAHDPVVERGAVSRRRPGRTPWRCSAPGRRSGRRRPGTRAPCGRNSIEACMCGGSAKSRCLPSIENGERTKPTASRPPRARVAARALSGGLAGRCLEADAVGGAAADDEDVAGLRGGPAAVAEDVAALDRVHVEDRRGHPQRARGRRARARCRSAAGR